MNLRTLLILVMMCFVVGCSSSDEGAMDDHSGMDMENGDMAMADDVDVSTNKMTDNGMFNVMVEPLVEPVVINELHTWQLTLTDMDKQPIDGATITFGGGMPEHNHGFPTEPEVVAGDAPGVYLIEGVKMQMAGRWEMELDIEAGGMADTVTFNIILP